MLTKAGKKKTARKWINNLKNSAGLLSSLSQHFKQLSAQRLMLKTSGRSRIGMTHFSLISCNQHKVLELQCGFLFVLRRHLCDWAPGLRGLPWILHHHRGHRWRLTAAQRHGYCEHQPDWRQRQQTCLQPGRLHGRGQRRHRAGKECDHGKNRTDALMMAGFVLQRVFLG